MATAVTEMVLTAEEFYELPDPPESGKAELIHGRVVREMPVGGQHGKQQVRIARALDAFAEAQGDAEVTVETGFILERDPDVVLAPDVALTLRSRLPGGQLPASGFVEGSPTLAVEVVSENEPSGRALAKAGQYLDAGTQRVWVVVTASRKVIVFSEGTGVEELGEDDVLTSHHAGVAPGFELPVRRILP